MMQQQELRELENTCIQEHAPWCTASCPVHVDVRGIASAIKAQDFFTALKVLRKTLPFPGIISRICDQPCQKECKRIEVGGAIEIALLERACVDFGSDPNEPIKPLPRKSKRVAVVGGGLSGLTVAYDLARKGYTVSIYEAGSQLGGSLWNYPQERLPFQVILSDLAVLTQLGVELLLDTPMGKVDTNGRLPPLTLLCQDYDAVYLGIGQDGTKNLRDLSDLNMDANGNIWVDPITFMTSQDGIFAGGSMVSTFHPRDQLSANQPFKQSGDSVVGSLPDLAKHTSSKSPITKISDGRRAAVSIERYMQKVSLTASREKEGSYETRLFTSTVGIRSELPVRPEDTSLGYSQEEALHEAERCLQCQCLECVKACEYLRHYGSYPKKYLREIYNNLSIVMGMRNSNQFINSCSLCGLCGEVCPTDLNMAGIIHTARQTMVEQNRMPPSAHEFALRDLEFSNGASFSFARHAPGSSISRYALFPGCQLCASSPDHIEALYKRIMARPAAKSDPIGLMLHCCGSPADWAGRTDLFNQSQESFYRARDMLGRPTLIVACSSCYRAFQDYYPEVEIVSLWEWMEGEEMLPSRVAPTDNPTLAIHDPCATRYEKNIHESVRRIIDRLGINFEELPLNREQTECCSFGGVMWLANPPLAQQVVERRIQASTSHYITYCAMCRDFFARQGKPALHILDLIFGLDPASAAKRPDPGFSRRRENRRDLKRSLLDQFWGETMEPLPEFSKIQLILSEEVQRLCEQRLILQEDIQRVIEHAEKTGSKLKDRVRGHWLASYRPANVTYWVEYLPEGEGFRVFRAYSHRMNVEAGGEK